MTPIRGKWSGMSAARRLLLIMTVLWMIFIYSNSLKNAEESTAQSDRVEDAVTAVIQQVKPASEGTVREPIKLRKFAHSAEFAVLGLLLTMLLKSEQRNIYKAGATAFALCVCVAVSDETLQYFVPGRGCQFSDVLRDSAGAGAAILAALLIAAACTKKRNKGR